MAVPQIATAAQPGFPASHQTLPGGASKQQAQIQHGYIDVSLAPGGLFAGQVVNAQGVAESGAEVVLRYQGQDVVRTVTDENGSFAARGLRGGQYEVQVSGGVVHCRLWTDRTAPPAARPSALIVADSDVMNGQGGFGSLLSNPFVLAGIVATAVAVPVVVAQNKDEPTS